MRNVVGAGTCLIAAVGATAVAAGLQALAVAASQPAGEPPAIHWFLAAMTLDEREASEALARIAERWEDRYAALLVDLARFTRPNEEARTVDVSGLERRADSTDLTYAPTYPGAQFRVVGGRRHPTAPVRARLVRFLERQTGRRFGDDLDRWRRWTWGLPYPPHPDYPAFKAELSRGVDPRMAAFLSARGEPAVRLDEIEWSGLGVDDAPPLVGPPHLGAAEARFLGDRHRVFGVQVNGEARAYPARLVAWHHVVHDRLGGREVLVAHCPASGVVAAYAIGESGPRRFGTSGLVYRATSLLYDRETDSVWSMLTGRPILGPLAGRHEGLEPLPVAVAAWREWRRDHPATTVLSPDTGHPFRYVEGALTRRRLLDLGFVAPSPGVARDLAGEAEVAGVRPHERAGARAVAVDVRSLGRRALRRVEAGGRTLVAAASEGGIVRLYEAPADVWLVRWQSDGCLEDERGACWRPREDALVPDGPGTPAARVPAVHAFWLAWAAEFPDTLIVR